MATTAARMPRGRRRGFLIFILVVAVLLILFTALSGFFVDLWWFGEVNLSSVFWTVLRTRLVLGLVFGLLFFGLLFVNLLIVRRLKPPFRAVTMEQEIFERYRMQLEPSLKWLIPLLSGVLALFVALAASTRWQVFLLWRNSGGAAFGYPDPLFGRDPAFYIFNLPWLHFVQGWLFSSLVGVTLIVAVAHYLWGGIRPQAPAFADKVTPQVKAHLSVLLGFIVLVKAWGYYLGRFDLLVSPRGVVTGASYTDVKAQLPALNLLAIIAIICSVLFLVNIRFKGWALPVIGVGLLALVSIVAGALIPAGVQRFSVAPQELQREQPYIEDNITATRRAFQLDTIVSRQRTVANQVSAADARNAGGTISNIRLWRPDILLQSLKSLQRIRQYYEFGDVDVDRYVIDGRRRMVMVAAREINQNGIPTGGATWQNSHLVYTHGFGSVASVANTATAQGGPDFTLRDLPPVGEPSLNTQPRIYYGEGEVEPFIVVKTGSKELDYQGTPGNDQAQVTSTYGGSGGIAMGNFLKRAVFAYRYRDVNLLISGLINANSRIMINRAIETRATKPVPFLKFDGDPYPAMINGRVVWIWDAYTTASAYPYSQEVDLSTATGDAIRGTANYIRNSVKVVVDAYNGTMTYYVTDPNDPIIQVWAKAFPGLFTFEQAPIQLREHFRYPENLFQIQAQQYANYHVTDPSVFYQKQDFWAIPVDPTVTGVTGESVTMDPYYVLMQLPGETEQEFALILPFTPQGRQNMVAWMAAKSNPDTYGQIVNYQFPVGGNVDGPQQVFARINQDPTFSAQRTLLSQGGSRVLFGNFLVMPIQGQNPNTDGMLYIQPVFVASDQPDSLPELKRVVVVNGSQVGIGNTLQDALVSSFTGQVPKQGGPGGGGQPPTGTNEQKIAQLIQQALARFAAADKALASGDLAAYQSELEKAKQLLQQANQLAAKAPSGGGQGSQASANKPTPTPTASPSPTSAATPAP